MIELAFVIPLILAIMLGIVDFGWSFSNLNSVRQGTRDAVRRAVVGDVGNDLTCPIVGGLGLTGDTHALVCLTKEMVGLDQGATRVSVGFDASYVEGDVLILCTQYPLESISGFYGFLLNGNMLQAQVHMRVERTNVNGVDIGLSSFQEIGDWSWCG